MYTPEITNVDGADATASVVCTVKNDQKKVTAILNQIHGRNHDGTASPGIPAVFGMNFQAVSVGQKLAKDNFDGSCAEDTDPLLNGQPGGYLDGSGTPSDVLAYSLEKTDVALQSMIAALRQQGIYDSTMFIVTAKHGQSPINPAKQNKVGHLSDGDATPPGAARDQAAVDRLLAQVGETARGRDNLLKPIREALRAYATIGEVCGVLREVFGEYRPGFSA